MLAWQSPSTGWSGKCGPIVQDGTISRETVWLSLDGEWSVLRWFCYGIWKIIWQSFTRLGKLATDHEVLTSTSLQICQNRSLVSSLVWLTRSCAILSVILCYFYIRQGDHHFSGGKSNFLAVKCLSYYFLGAHHLFSTLLAVIKLLHVSE